MGGSQARRVRYNANWGRARSRKTLTHCELKDGFQAHLSEQALCGGRKRLGESLVDLGYITEAEIQKALGVQKRYRQLTVVDVLVEEGH